MIVDLRRETSILRANGDRFCNKFVTYRKETKRYNEKSSLPQFAEVSRYVWDYGMR